MPQTERTMTGRVVRTPDASSPYKVVLEGELGLLAEHPVRSVREGEALIRAHRRELPVFQTSAKPSSGLLRLVAGSRE